MPFRKEWKRLVTEDGQPNRRLDETAVLATLRDRRRSGDVWVERSANYRRFDSYLLPAEVPPIAAKLGFACDGRRMAGQAWRRTRSSPAGLRPPAPPRRTRGRRIA
jgi:hypothetical protein